METRTIPTDTTPRVFLGDALRVLRSLPESSVQCVVTSYPYWGLRDYGTCPCSVKRYVSEEALEMAGRDPEGSPSSGQIDPADPRCRRDPDPGCPYCHGSGRIEMETIWDEPAEPCAHEWETTTRYWDNRHAAALAAFGSDDLGSGQDARARVASTFCRTCGAWRGAFGLEPTVEAYVRHAAQIGEELRRVLRPDGTFWLNLGDCYSGSGKGPEGNFGKERDRQGGSSAGLARPPVPRGLRAKGLAGGPTSGQPRSAHPGLKPKDLVGVPWRVAFALQEAGWYLRCDAIWAKPNPMPESVRDRPARSHEYVFLLSKSERYYYDAEAVRGPLAASTAERAAHHYSNPADNPAPDSKWGKDEWRSYPVIGRSFAPSTIREVLEGYDGEAKKDYEGARAQNPSATKARIIAGMRKRLEAQGYIWLSDPSDPTRARAGFRQPQVRGANGTGSVETSKYAKPGGWGELPRVLHPLGANLKSVWFIPTQPYPEAHFATYPEALVETCVRAGTSQVGACSICGTPWKREVRAEGGTIGHDWHPDKSLDEGRNQGIVVPGSHDGTYRRVDLGFVPGCAHVDAPKVPCVVLDPFSGSGTTLAVARRLERRSVGIELNPVYAEIARKRVGRYRDLLSYAEGDPPAATGTTESK